MRMKIPCHMHSDCFANLNGNCVCLSDNRFKGKDCPFYKTKAKNDAERSRAEQTLISRGRTDLLEHYGRANT